MNTKTTGKNMRNGFLLAGLGLFCLGLRADFNVRDFGATGDGVAKDTAAIQKALDTCAGRGERVIVPAGTYLTGTLWLRSRTELRLEKGAVLLGSPDLADYNDDRAFPQNYWSPVERWSGKHLVIAHEVEDVAISGEGTIDGNGAAFLDANTPPQPERKTRMAYRLGYINLKEKGSMARPGQELAFYESRGIRLEGVTLRNMAMWTCFLHGCDDVEIRNVKIDNDLRFANTDGFDIDACRNVRITGCDVSTADDAFAIRCCPKRLKSKRALCEDIVIDDCRVRTECEVVRIGVGDGLVRNVRITNLDVSDAGRGFVVQSIYPGSKYKGLGIENVYIADCRLRKVVQAIAVTAGTTNAASALRNVTFERIDATLEGGVMVNGLGATRPTDVLFRDVRLRAVTGDYVLGHDWEVGKMDTDPKNVIRVERADGVVLDNVRVSAPADRPRVATRDARAFVDAGEGASLRPAKGSFLDPILPHGLNQGDLEGEIAELRRIHAKTGIRRFVLHAPGHGVRVTGRVNRDTYERIGDDLAKVQAALKDDGVLVGFNVMPTIKCGCRHGFTPVTDIDGKLGPVAACPLDPGFQEFLVGNVAEVAKRAKPFKIMMEDDYQLRNHNEIRKGVFSLCFCARHLANFAKLAGRAYAREELKDLLSAATPEGQRLRDLWWECSCRSMEELSRKVEAAVHAVSPETTMAYSATEPCNYAGSSPDRIERALAGPNRRPMMRFTGACYGHDVPFGFASIPLSSMFGRENCGEDYHFLYEGDPCPHLTFYASAVRMEALLTYVLFSGIDTIHFWGAPTYPGGMDAEPAYLDMFVAKHRKMEAVRDLANESRLVGPCLTEVSWMKERVRTPGDRDGFDCSWARVFGAWGFPFHTRPDRVTAVKGYLALRSMPKGEIERILSGPVLLDGSAAVWLCENGYGADIGCTATHPTGKVDFSRDVVGDLDELADLRKSRQPCAFHQNYGNDGSPVAIVKEAPGALLWSRYCTDDGTYRSASVMSYANARGGRVVVLAPELECTDTSNVFNPVKREIVRRAFEWAGADLAAAALDRCNVTVLAREARDGQTLYLNLTSNNCDVWDSIRLAVAPRFAGTRVELLGDDGAWHAAEADWKGRELTLKARFLVYSPVIVRLTR